MPDPSPYLFSFDAWVFITRVAAVLGVISGILVSAGIIHARVIGPWVAKPVAKAIRHELSEAVEAIILSDLIQGHIKEHTEEIVAHEMVQVMRVLAEYDDKITTLDTKVDNVHERLTVLEGNVQFIKDRMAERPPR